MTMRHGQDRLTVVHGFVAVMPGTKLQEHTGSDKAWVWSTMDFASEEQRMELFCLKLPSPASEYLDLVGLAVCRCSHHPPCFRLQGGDLTTLLVFRGTGVQEAF